jgi:hypothetical protein
MFPRLPIQACDNRKKMEPVQDFFQWWVMFTGDAESPVLPQVTQLRKLGFDNGR